MSEKQYRDKIADVRKQQAVQEKALATARAAASEHRADAAKELGKVTARTSESSAKSYRRNAESADRRAITEDGKVTTASTKLGQLARDLATAQTNLDREVAATARRESSKAATAARAAEQAVSRQRAAEKAHAREIARLSNPTVRHVHEVRAVPAPQPEKLRVLYLTANPEQNLRTDVEVRNVQEAVRRATHRDLIEIDYRPAATAEDLINGLNDSRPHVVHFSGHAGDAALLFDNASVEAPEGREVPYDLLGRALASTSTPPVLLVLNGCDTLEGAETLLDATAVVVATASSISDLAASVFAAKFYAAIAAAQPIAAAVAQGTVSVDLAGLDEGWKLDILVRPGIDTSQRVLVHTVEAL